MSIPDDQNDERTGTQMPEETEFLEAYRGLDEADQVLVWSTILTELSRRGDPDEE